MGLCSSCLTSREDPDEAERSRLLAEDPYFHPYPNYGAGTQPTVQPLSTQTPEQQKREEEAMRNIMRWASDQIVEIFPINSQRTQMPLTNNLNGSTISLHQTDGLNGMTNSTHQDILLSMIPGDKSKRSIRIYPASRPTSKDAQSVRSKASQARLNGSVRSAKNKDGFSNEDQNIPGSNFQSFGTKQLEKRQATAEEMGSTLATQYFCF